MTDDKKVTECTCDEKTDETTKTEDGGDNDRIIETDPSGLEYPAVTLFLTLWTWPIVCAATEGCRKHAAEPKGSFQDLILTLHQYWGAKGCVILQPYDMEVGAGTFHPATTLRSVGPKPWAAAYVQPSRRPKDGRYGENPNRLQHYYQYQVIIKPSPPDLQELYLGSLDGHRHRSLAARHPLRRG